MTQDCILCGANSFKETIYSNINNCKVLQCSECSLVFTEIGKEFSSTEAMNTIYYGDIKGYLRRRREFIHRFRNFLRRIEKFKNKGRILDIGCCVGFFLHVAQKMGWDCVGVELATTSANYAKDEFKLNVMNKKLEEIKFPDKHFDVITMWDVLEHIPDPVNGLNEVYRILKDDGLLVVQVPNIKSAKAILEGKVFVFLNVPCHLYHFSPLTIRKILEKANFKVIKVMSYEAYDTMFDWFFPYLLTIINTSSPKVRIGVIMIRKGIKLIFYALYPLLKPFQILICKINRGGQIQVYALKNRASRN
ncbi:MAG: class I SAM-dependent methyltransferase [bacterium]